MQLFWHREALLLGRRDRRRQSHIILEHVVGALRVAFLVNLLIHLIVLVGIVGVVKWSLIPRRLQTCDLYQLVL